MGCICPKRSDADLPRAKPGQVAPQPLPDVETGKRSEPIQDPLLEPVRPPSEPARPPSEPVRPPPKPVKPAPPVEEPTKPLTKERAPVPVPDTPSPRPVEPFVVRLERPSSAHRWGFLWNTDTLTRNFTRVLDDVVAHSFAAEWNAMHPEFSIRKGDSLMKVNGKAGRLELHTKELGKNVISCEFRPGDVKTKMT
mmetsp:Transcript_56468/g.151035  ORF Transcript_56468/g.151035 Transcript_56468/m.151035 type:complete len:195 (-) Transcript_56468:196-780(-)